MLSEVKLGVSMFLDWSYGGVNFTGPGNNGGAHCRDHVTNEHRVVETIIGLVFSFVSALIGYRLHVSKGGKNNNNNNVSRSKSGRHSYSLGRIFLLMIHSFVFGIEVGFKFSSRQLIFLLNPCHVSTCIQIYLLATPAGLFTHNVSIYRLMLHYLHGPLAAILFPVTECLLLPFEVSIYWIQHVLLLVVPIYLLLCDHESDENEVNYTAHETLDFAWIFASFGLWTFWHFAVMHGVSFLTLVNVGSMLCSAPSDPFEGPSYRLIGIVHQFCSIVVMGNLTAFLGRHKRRQNLTQKVVEKNN